MHATLGNGSQNATQKLQLRYQQLYNVEYVKLYFNKFPEPVKVPKEYKQGFSSCLMTGEFYVINGIIFHDLDKMPYDHCGSDGFTLFHATGREYWSYDLHMWIIEYEDEVVE